MNEDIRDAIRYFQSEIDKHGEHRAYITALKVLRSYDYHSKHKVGDSVWWVHCSGRVYRGRIESIDLCEYQGALYCVLHSPDFKVNQNPVVHYSNVFRTRSEAREFARYQKRNPDNVFPMCIGCHYHYSREKESNNE